ncbi:MAG: leucine-rich repeat protein [Bacteroidales bacterium]|nr:leucine-rich repeat protein [Bacteroidales bacterium]
MKKGFVLQSLICLLAVSCSVHEVETMGPIPVEDDVFYASLESYSAPDTRVYVDVNTTVLDEDEKTLFLTFWDAKDQISIFNRNTLNKQYEFMGATGDNSGYFKKISEANGTGASLNYVCAVYPYQESTVIDGGVLTLILPSEQTYREKSFGLGANTMVSTTNGDSNLLRFMNVGGYLVFKFWGKESDGSKIPISSIKLEGRNEELLSGEATMTPAIDGVPSIEMASTAGKSITLDCNNIKIGKKVSDATVFWMAVPPTRFTKGFTVTVTTEDGRVFIKETDKDITVERNHVSTMAVVEVKPEEPLDPNKVIYYTTSDKSVITPNENADFGANFVSTKYLDLKGVMVFDGNVTAIGENAFKNCENLTGMTIPETVTTIGDYAFAECTSLGAYDSQTNTTAWAPAKAPDRSDETSIVIPDGVTSIGAFAFQNCISLTSVTIPDSVESIDASAFAGCTSIQHFSGKFASEDGLYLIDDKTVLAAALGSIEEGATIVIPDGIESIDDYAFAGCKNLTEVIIPGSVKSIGRYAFYECSNLTEVSIPESVESIGASAFEDCEELLSINIPSRIKRIEGKTFAACMSLPSITIPDGVEYIGSSAFESCFALANVTLPTSVNYLGDGAFASCNSFTSFDIPASVTTINGSTFYSCDNLTDVSIAEGITAIGFWAFADCPLLSYITIPSTVISIDDQAFLDCPGLNSITVLATAPPIDVSERTFENTNDCPIFVPAESLEAYKTAEGWSNYASRIHTIDSPDHTIQGHAYVDMGTGLKWATMNVGATAVGEDGERFVWSAGKAAAESWGGNWRLPTKTEFEILMDENKYTWTWDSTNEGYIVESKIQGYVGNAIFLPTTGFVDPAPESSGTFDYMGCYWSSTPGEQGFYHLDFEEGAILLFPYVHEVALGVRPVSD